MWNSRHPAKPAISSVKVSRTHFKDVYNDLKHVCKEMKKVFGEQSSLEREGYILERSIYRRNNQLRNSKVLHGLQKVNQCVRRWQELDLIEISDTISHILTSSGTDHLYLPCRPLIQYLLLRLIGTAHLSDRIMTCCFHTYVHVLGYLNLGHLADTMLFYIGLVSRFWVLFRGYLKQCIRLYNRLRQTEAVIPWSGTAGVNTELDLPEDLEYLDPERRNDSLSTTLSMESTGPVKKEIDSQGDKPSSQIINEEDLGAPVIRKQIKKKRKLYHKQTKQHVDKVSGKKLKKESKNEETGTRNTSIIEGFVDLIDDRVSGKEIRGKRKNAGNIDNDTDRINVSHEECQVIKTKKGKSVDVHILNESENVNKLEKQKKRRVKRNKKNTVAAEETSVVKSKNSVRQFLVDIKTAENFTQLRMLLNKKTFKSCSQDPTAVVKKLKSLKVKYKQCKKQTSKEKLLNKGKITMRNILRDYVKSR